MEMMIMHTPLEHLVQNLERITAPLTICYEKALVVGKHSKVQNIGVKGETGSEIAEGIGTITFTINNSHGINHNIEKYNVIYLPTAAKNLILTSHWSSDKKHDAGVMHKKIYSIFT